MATGNDTPASAGFATGILPSLDLFSISPTNARQEREAKSYPCIYNAPHFAYQNDTKKWHITQGNCHHWDCPRCGLNRAKTEYARMVLGCTHLHETMPLYFLTITCKGLELDKGEADEKYGEWTNRLLDACRAQAKRKDREWHYVQVTERQKRGHPHSHFITSYCPPDAEQFTKRKRHTAENGKVSWRSYTALRSRWFANQVCHSGLGEQYDITKIENAASASRYAAKYLFKDSIFVSDWPKKWRRIRYSQSFPKMPEIQTNAIVLITHEDWYKLAMKTAFVTVDNLDVFAEAQRHLWYHDTIIRLKTTHAA